jgi:hypothetical protein
MPGARCTRSLVGGYRVEVLTSVVTTSRPGSPGIPRAMGYSLLRALPGEPGLFATVISGISSTDLIPASGRQDHTTSPSASSTSVVGTLRVHRILSRVRDVASRPSEWDRTKWIYE